MFGARKVVLFGILLLVSSVFLFSYVSGNPTIGSIFQSTFNGNYVSGSLMTSISLSSTSLNGNNITRRHSGGVLIGPFPQPDNYTCMQTVFSVLTATKNITQANITSKKIFTMLTNLTNNSASTGIPGLIDVLNLTLAPGQNITIYVSGPYITINVTNITIKTSNGGTITINTTYGPNIPGSGGTGSTPAGTGSGGGVTPGGSSGGPTYIWGAGILFPSDTGHWIIIIEDGSTFTGPDEIGGVYFNGNRGLKLICPVTIWDPITNKYSQTVMTCDRKWVKVGNLWTQIWEHLSFK